MKNSLTAVFMSAIVAFAQLSNMSVTGLICYDRIVLEDMDDYPFGGIRFGAGFGGFIPITDIASFGIGASIEYGSVSASDDDAKLTFSFIGLGFSPKVRIGEQKKHVDISLGISIPIESEMTAKAYGETRSRKVDSDVGFGIAIDGRYGFIELGLSKQLDKDGTTGLSAYGYMPLSEKLELVPCIVYFADDSKSETFVGVGVEYTF